MLLFLFCFFSFSILTGFAIFHMSRLYCQHFSSICIELIHLCAHKIKKNKKRTVNNYKKYWFHYYISHKDFSSIMYKIDNIMSISQSEISFPLQVVRMVVVAQVRLFSTISLDPPPPIPAVCDTLLCPQVSLPTPNPSTSLRVHRSSSPLLGTPSTFLISCWMYSEVWSKSVYIKI